VRGYINKPEETAAFFIQLDGRLWYRTGDIVRIDQDGWLFFVDRAGDTIKHKGYRVSASRIEAALQGHPAVIAASVIGVPDQDVGERVRAFVVLKKDVRGVTAYDLIARCREELAPYEVPHYTKMQDMLPKSEVGKVLQRELRADERRKLEID
jgi:long-chain acyl-CoA synthetase